MIYDRPREYGRSTDTPFLVAPSSVKLLSLASCRLAMSGSSDIVEFLLTAFILQPRTSVEQIKLLISFLPDNSALRKRCEMALAWREGRSMELFSIAMGEVKGMETIQDPKPMQHNLDINGNYCSTTPHSGIRRSLTAADREYIANLVETKGKKNFLMKEKQEIAEVLGVSVAKVSNRIKYIRNVLKPETKRGVTHPRTEDSAITEPLIFVDCSPKE